MISTYEHDYPITGVREQNELFSSYICRNVSGGGLCTILSVHDRKLFPSWQAGSRILPTPALSPISSSISIITARCAS